MFTAAPRSANLRASIASYPQYITRFMRTRKANEYYDKLARYFAWMFRLNFLSVNALETIFYLPPTFTEFDTDAIHFG
jgi:hypothetical protein